MNYDRIKPRVTVRDLLRLKRAERPDAEFWQQFEQEMRHKQLAAIVEPRPWWAPFIRIGTKVARYQLPVGATAILALTFLTVREYRMPEAPANQFGARVVESTVDTMPGSLVMVAELSEANVAEAAVSAIEVANVSMESTQPADVVSQQPAAVVAEVSQPEKVYSPAAEAIAANLAAVKANSPELAQLVARVSGVNDIINPRTPSQVMDPLTRVKSPRASRRASRLLASALPVKYTGAKSRSSSSRIERNLTEDRMYDSPSRFDVTGESLAIRF